MILRPPRSTLFPTRRSSDLFKGPRPLIAAAPESTTYGATFSVDTPDAADIRSVALIDRKSTRLNSSHLGISYAVFCLKKKTTRVTQNTHHTTTNRLPTI